MPERRPGDGTTHVHHTHVPTHRAVETRGDLRASEMGGAREALGQAPGGAGVGLGAWGLRKEPVSSSALSSGPPHLVTAGRPAAGTAGPCPVAVALWQSRGTLRGGQDLQGQPAVGQGPAKCPDRRMARPPPTMAAGRELRAPGGSPVELSAPGPAAPGTVPASSALPPAACGKGGGPSRDPQEQLLGTTRTHPAWRPSPPCFLCPAQKWFR